MIFFNQGNLSQPTVTLLARSTCVIYPNIPHLALSTSWVNARSFQSWLDTCFLETKSYSSIRDSPLTFDDGLHFCFCFYVRFTLCYLRTAYLVVVTTDVSFSPFHQIFQSSLSTMTSVNLYQNCKFILAIIISNSWRQLERTWLCFYENERIP